MAGFSILMEFNRSCDIGTDDGREALSAIKLFIASEQLIIKK